MSDPANTYLAFDLGASSGRAVLGIVKDGRLTLDEIHRFPNAPVPLLGRLHWDVLALWGHMLDSMRRCAARGCDRVAGLGVDSWGVDFGLLGTDGRLLADPLCYRDAITEGAEQAVADRIDAQELFGLTGWPPVRVSTLSELVALGRAPGGASLEQAAAMLFIPDLFRCFLSGHRAAELTAAGSSQLTGIRSRGWCQEVLRQFNLPAGILPEIIRAGTVVGPLAADVADAVAMAPAPVIAVAGHDTASAAAAVPWADADCAFISCGTWSVVGAIQAEPVTSADAFARGFVNEFGLDAMLLVQNRMGLYLFESLYRAVARRRRGTSYARIIKEASQAAPLAAFLDLGSPRFFATDDPEPCIHDFLRRTGQRALPDTASSARAILEGLAWTYRGAIGDLEAVTGRQVRRICLVGGGSRNGLLCQMAADATGREVVAGPAEATAAGNVAVQALAVGQLGTAADIRSLVRRSFRLRTYRPRSEREWDENDRRYQEVIKRAKPVP